MLLAVIVRPCTCEVARGVWIACVCHLLCHTAPAKQRRKLYVLVHVNGGHNNSKGGSSTIFHMLSMITRQVCLTACAGLSRPRESTGNSAALEGDFTLCRKMLFANFSTNSQDLIVFKPPEVRVQSHTKKLTSWHARLGILKEICSELPCSVIIEEVDESKQLTGAMSEVHLYENKVELTGESWKCSVFPTNAMSFNFFMWSKAVMSKLPIEETKMSNTDVTVSMWPEGETKQTSEACCCRLSCPPNLLSNLEHGTTLCPHERLKMFLRLTRQNRIAASG